MNIKNRIGRVSGEGCGKRKNDSCSARPDKGGCTGAIGLSVSISTWVVVGSMGRMHEPSGAHVRGGVEETTW